MTDGFESKKRSLDSVAVIDTVGALAIAAYMSGAGSERVENEWRRAEIEQEKLEAQRAEREGLTKWRRRTKKERREGR